VEDGGESEGDDGGSEAEGAHTPLDDEVGGEFEENVLERDLCERCRRPTVCGWLILNRLGMAAAMCH
jgi:hypothetical protein